jgi:hypothetical protein
MEFTKTVHEDYIPQKTAEKKVPAGKKGNAAESMSRLLFQKRKGLLFLLVDSIF